MKEQINYDVIIIGGSYAGLSAAIALGRSLRKALIIDSGKPCNRYARHSHNFITHDGRPPAEIREAALKQVLRYDTVQLVADTVTDVSGTDGDFEVKTVSKQSYVSKKLIIATGVKDQFPDIVGFAECWGKSIVHCPYCHGYELRGKRTGIMANGEKAAHMAPLVKNLTDQVFVITNGKAEFTEEHRKSFDANGIEVIESKILSFHHNDGQLTTVDFEDSQSLDIDACYAAIPFEQTFYLHKQLGCELNEQGLMNTDMFQKTTIAGLYACGDNSSLLRAVSNAIATGNIAGAMVNNELSNEQF